MLVPVFALLMWLFFRRRERAYSDYLVFSLHYNSMVFLLLSVWTVLNKVFPKVELDGWFFLWIPAIYLAIAIKKVYGTRIVPMLLKISLLGLIYLIIMLIIFVAVIVFIAVFVEKIDVTAAGTP
jgi:hypothetical protein